MVAALETISNRSGSNVGTPAYFGVDAHYEVIEFDPHGELGSPPPFACPESRLVNNSAARPQPVS